MGIVINDKSQISAARRLKCDGIFNKYFIANLRWACDERIVKIGEHFVTGKKVDYLKSHVRWANAHPTCTK